jgi:hypothetical protein
MAQKAAGLRRGSLHPPWPGRAPSPREAATLRHQRHRASWVEGQRTLPAPRAVEVMPGDAVESRGALFLGRLPFSANRM